MKTKPTLTIRIIQHIVSAAALLWLGASCTTAQAARDPLPSWNEAPPSRHCGFVRATTAKGSPKYVSLAEAHRHL